MSLAIVDRLLRYGAPEERESILADIGRSTLVNADNVARMFVDMHGHCATPEYADFPGARPPWPRTWVCFNLPVDPLLNNGERSFSYCVITDSRDSTLLPGVTWIRALIHQVEARDAGYPAYCGGVVAAYSSDRDFAAPLPNDWDQTPRLIEKANMLGVSVPVGGTVMAFPDHIPADRRERWGRTILSSILPVVLLTFSLTNCRNVQRVEEARGVRRSFARRHQDAPALRSYTLAISPMQRELTRAMRAQGVGLTQALHLCRGHFKTFTPERPMFGRHVGRYWWPQHVRGDVARGAVVKDYAVEGAR